MSPRRLRIEHASAFFLQAQADLQFATHIYQDSSGKMRDNSHPFFCGTMAYSQQAIEKAIKGFLIKKGIVFPFTHHILKWCYETRSARSVRALLGRQLGTVLFQNALLTERYAPSVEVQGRDGRYSYLLTGKNTEYPFLIPSRNRIEIPADTFSSDEAQVALKAARRILQIVSTAPL